MVHNSDTDSNGDIQYNIKQRRFFIVLIYRYYVLEKTLSSIILDINEDSQVRLSKEQKQLLISWFERTSEVEDFCSKFLVKWEWKRLPNIHKACLFYGYFEITDLKHKKAVVINEMLKLATIYLPSEKNGYINAILDKLDDNNEDDE